jgi:hypothetical protein
MAQTRSPHGDHLSITPSRSPINHPMLITRQSPHVDSSCDGQRGFYGSDTKHISDLTYKIQKYKGLDRFENEIIHM